jgi:tRNA/rRNA methyltransferase
MLSRVRIVLISPSGAGNVGSVARVMANMGLDDLAIVAPRCDVRDAQAIAYASHGRPVLDGARVVAEIPAALEGCARTYVTTSRLGLYRRQAATTPAEAAGEALRTAGQRPVAFVFGREDYGLKVRELLHFDRVVTIPADEGYPVLNLAMSVGVICYELRRTWLAQSGQPELPMAIDGGVATNRAKEVMFGKLFDALGTINFLHEHNPDRLKHALRHMFGRIDLGVNEVDILTGMAQQIRWYADHHRTRTDPPGEGGDGGC